MAPNGSSRKAPAVPKKLARVQEAIPLKSLFDDLNDNGSPEIREKSLPASSRDVNGKAMEHSPSGSPAMNKVPPDLAKAFPTSRPMKDKPEILKCNHCKRAVSKHAMPKHIEACLNKKQEKQRKKKEAKDARDAAARKEKNGVGDSDEDEDEAGKSTMGSKTGGLGASKKRKAGEEGEEGGPVKKKKKKDDAKAKASRPKAPVDVEKQCGVELPNGGKCARSLTCKSHSMGAKRGVAGRSAPYDKLLADYQRKNQAKLQKAQFDALAPNPDDDDLPSGPVDPEEEKDAVMSSIGRHWGGAPIYQRTPVPLKARYEHNRIRGMIQSAFGGRQGAGIFGNSNAGGSGGGASGGFFGSAPAPVVDDQGIVHARRGSVVPGARSMMAPGARKPSVAPTIGA